MVTALTAGRAAAEALMVATCTISRGAGDPVWDGGAGTYTPAPPEVIYAGRCRVKAGARVVRDAEAGELTVGVGVLELHLPITAESGLVRRGDVARIDVNPTDPALVGRELVVQAPHAATTKTARKLPVEAVL